MEKKRLSKKSISFWRWRITLSAIVISFLLGVLYYFFHLIAMILSAIFVMLYLTLIIVYFPLLYKSSYYMIEQRHIIIERGIIYKRVIKISIPRIQYVETITGPLQRIFKLNSIILHTAGSQKIIGPLDTSESLRIKQYIEGFYEEI